MRLRQPFVLAAAALLAAVAAADELKTLASVAELHAMTAESAGRGVALLVYAPWCGHSRALLPHVEKAAAQLKGKVGFAKVDGTEAEALATKLDVKGYPTLLYVRSSDGPPIEFDGAREASAIVRWAQQKMEPAMARLGSAAEVTKWAGGKKPVALVLFTTPSADASADAKAAEEALLGVAAAAEHVPCAIATVAPSEASLGLSAAVGGVALTPPLLVAFITHDDGQPLLLAPSAAEPLTHARMLRFARAAALPAVSAYENGAAEEALFGADVPLHLLYFHEAPLADDVRSAAPSPPRATARRCRGGSARGAAACHGRRSRAPDAPSAAPSAAPSGAPRTPAHACARLRTPAHAAPRDSARDYTESSSRRPRANSVTDLRNRPPGLPRGLCPCLAPAQAHSDGGGEAAARPGRSGDGGHGQACRGGCVLRCQAQRGAAGPDVNGVCIGRVDQIRALGRAQRRRHRRLCE